MLRAVCFRGIDDVLVLVVNALNLDVGHGAVPAMDHRIEVTDAGDARMVSDDAVLRIAHHAAQTWDVVG